MSTSETASPDGTLVVVSNRLPYNLPRGASVREPKRNVGGLVNALEPVLAAGYGAWIGWDGHALSSAAAVSAALAEPRSWRTPSGIELYGVPLSEREMLRYYRGLSNRTIWPLFHGLLDKTVFLPEDYAAYCRVNHRFAQTTLARAAKGDRIWVHDYQMMLVPRFLREMGFQGLVDFFMHIPFPPPEIYRALPWREEIIQSLLSSDTVAFHVESYRDNFVRAATGLFDGRVTGKALGSEVLLSHPWGDTIAAFAPIGIEVEEFERIAGLDSVADKVRRLERAHGGRRILFGADRLDYTKGIKERLLATERFLARYPDRAGSFDLLQVVVPSRSQVEEYRGLKREIDQHVGRINGEFGRDGWTPIHYRYRALAREELVSLYRAASVAVVTPLRDGMNLVAPEFVASRTDDDGVLVLSEFAGVSEHLTDALRVNPYDIDSFAETLRQALDMPEEARGDHMRGLRRTVSGNPISKWAKRCLGLGGSRKHFDRSGVEVRGVNDAAWRHVDRE